LGALNVARKSSWIPGRSVGMGLSSPESVDAKRLCSGARLKPIYLNSTRLRSGGLAKAHPMEMRGRSMQGWLRVDAEKMRTKAQLAKWVEHGTSYAMNGWGASEPAWWLNRAGRRDPAEVLGRVQWARLVNGRGSAGANWTRTSAATPHDARERRCSHS